MNGEKILLRVYLQSADRAPHTPTYARIVEFARRRQMAGATVLRGIKGIGYHGVIQSAPLSIVEHVPIIVEIVDDAERINDFLTSMLQSIFVTGMATLERAAVMMYRQRKQAGNARLQLSGEVEPLTTIPTIEARPGMTINENSVLLRVFIGESDRYEHRPLYDQILQKVRELGLAGATVLRGSEGFGANSIVHKSSLLAMSSDLPLVIEIVDSEEKIKLLLPHLEQMVHEGMITMEHVVLLMYRHNP